jgi:CarD family transcriptional regulator
LLRSEKELSFSEKKMMDLARTHLFKELELSVGEEELRKDDEIKKIFDVKS